MSEVSQRRCWWARQADFLLLLGLLLLVMAIARALVIHVGGSRFLAHISGVLSVWAVAAVAIVVSFRRLQNERQTPGQALMGIRLVADAGKEPPSLGRWLGAYYGMKQGDDLFARMKLSYDPSMRDKGTQVRAVSTR